MRKLVIFQSIGKVYGNERKDQVTNHIVESAAA